MSHVRLRFGREVLVPKFAEFALRLWIYLSNLDRADEIALLFCGRGGLRLQLLYERFLAASRLETPIYTNNLMVSRIVAVRPALLRFADSASKQLSYEFSGNILRQLAKAVSGLDPIEAGGSADAWNHRYTHAVLTNILTNAAGRMIVSGIQVQTERFQSHLHARSGGRQRIVLCDTGLFGSTMQLLAAGIPGLAWSSCLFARANYKHLPAPHFARTVGLCVKADQYSPLDARTAVLRHWHLIGSFLEPDLPSVVHFDDGEGAPQSNLETMEWERQVAPEPRNDLRRGNRLLRCAAVPCGGVADHHRRAGRMARAAPHDRLATTRGRGEPRSRPTSRRLRSRSDILHPDCNGALSAARWPLAGRGGRPYQHEAPIAAAVPRRVRLQCALVLVDRQNHDAGLIE